MINLKIYYAVWLGEMFIRVQLVYAHAHMLGLFFCRGHPSSCERLLFDRNGATKMRTKNLFIHKRRLDSHYETVRYGFRLTAF